MASDKSERRGLPRQKVRWNATWKVYDESGPGVLDEGDVMDISAEGLFLHPYTFTAHPLFRGTRVRIGVIPPGESRELTLTGTVRWFGIHRGHREGGVGIEIDDDSQRELHPFLKTAPTGKSES